MVDSFSLLVVTPAALIIISGLIATFGYEIIPFKAYVIVAAVIGLLLAMILTKFKVFRNG